MRWRTQSLLAMTLTLVTLATLATGGAALAREPIPLTPVANPGEGADCTVEPANLDRVSEIAGSAVNDPDATLGSDPPIAGGDIVTGPDAEAVIALMEQMIACVNANDAARFLGLFSDDFIRRAAYEIGGILEGAEARKESESGEPADDTGDVEASAGDPVIIIGASDVYAQPDGRLAYSVSIGEEGEFTTDTPPAPSTLLQIIAVEQRGAWKIDELREQSLNDPGEPTACAGDGDGCGSPRPGSDNGVEGDGYSGWLMTTAAAESAAVLFLPLELAYTPFQPTADQVAEAEAALPEFLAGHSRATDAMRAGAGDHDRQYFGYDTPEGALLVINAFCGEAPFGDPATEVVAVEDGGDCYWQATYNLTEGAFTTLHVNGEA